MEKKLLDAISPDQNLDLIEVDCDYISSDQCWRIADLAPDELPSQKYQF